MANNYVRAKPSEIVAIYQRLNEMLEKHDDGTCSYKNGCTDSAIATEVSNTLKAKITRAMVANIRVREFGRTRKVVVREVHVHNGADLHREIHKLHEILAAHVTEITRLQDCIIKVEHRCHNAEQKLKGLEEKDNELGREVHTLRLALKHNMGRV